MRIVFEITGVFTWVAVIIYLFILFVPYEAAWDLIKDLCRRTYLGQWYEWKMFMKVYDETKLHGDDFIRLRRYFSHWKRFKTNIYRDKYQAVLDWEAAKYEYELLFIEGEEPNLPDFII